MPSVLAVDVPGLVPSSSCVESRAMSRSRLSLYGVCENESAGIARPGEFFKFSRNNSGNELGLAVTEGPVHITVLGDGDEHIGRIDAGITAQILNHLFEKASFSPALARPA